MTGLKICRICLCQGVKMYSYDRYYLKQYYEEVMAKKINAEDGLPCHFCYLCASMLHKLHKFKEKCYTGEMTLNELLWSGNLNLSSISEIKRQNKKFQSTIDLIKVNKRVKTCRVKSNTMSETASTEEIEDNKISVSGRIIPLLDSNNSLDDENLAEVKSEITDNHFSDESIVIEENFIPNSRYVDDQKILIPIAGVHDEDRTFSDDDDDFKPALNATSSNKEVINNSVTMVNENINLKNETEKNDSKNAATEKKKVSKSKATGKKAKKFEKSKSMGGLDPKCWLKINLTEEEALQNFMARAEDPKYLKAAFKCTLCYKGFSTEDMLNRHKLSHSESVGPIECRFCQMRFKIKCFLTKHIVQHYHKYKCLRCDVICPLLTTAVFHNEFHSGAVKICKHCGQEFRHTTTYYTHLRTHRSEHVCTLCGESFVSAIGLKQHKNIKHYNTVLDPKEQETTYCEKCDIKFETRTAYDQHVFQSAKHAEEFVGFGDNQPTNLKAGRMRKLVRRKQRTSCTICNKTFPNQSSYLKHHHSEHKGQSVPMETERHICEICGASLAAASVASHLNTHTREIQFSCPTCHMQFTSKASMKRHQLTHTGEKPFECSLCEKRFTQKCSMLLHYRTFHLKEPYPKRNRRKNPGVHKGLDQHRTHEDPDNVILKGYHLRV